MLVADLARVNRKTEDKSRTALTRATRKQLTLETACRFYPWSNMSSKPKNTLKLSPNVRLRMTLAREMDLDSNREFFTNSVLDGYIRMHGEALKRQGSMIGLVVVCDALLAFLIAGKSFDIPYFGVSVIEVPAASEILLVLSSLGFLFCNLSFLNAQLYFAQIQCFVSRDTEKAGIDSDFISSSLVYTELYVKLFSGRMRPSGDDYFSAGKKYTIFYNSIMASILILMLFVLSLHFILSLYAIYVIIDYSIIDIIIATIVIMANLIGIACNLLLEFDFTIND